MRLRFSTKNACCEIFKGTTMSAGPCLVCWYAFWNDNRNRKKKELPAISYTDTDGRQALECKGWRSFDISMTVQIFVKVSYHIWKQQK
jgi:hypothetical protein